MINKLNVVTLHDIICFYCALCSKSMVVSLGPYSCAHDRIWLAYADCGFVVVIYRTCSLYLDSDLLPI